GNIIRHKGRLVVRGYSQQPGNDFEEIFSPVVRYDSLRLLIALSFHFNWLPDQLDIKGAFLYGYLQDEIYMALPVGYEQDGHCAGLNRSIYGLKQSPKAWYDRLTSYLLPLGFQLSSFDPCVLINLQDQIFIAIYVDDITVFGRPRQVRTALKNALKSEFQLTELG